MAATPPPGRPRIRPAVVADLPVCAALLKDWLASAADMAVGQRVDLEFDYENELRQTLKAEGEAFFVAEDEEGVQGFITLRGNSHRNPDLINRAGSLIRRVLSRGRMRSGAGRRVGIIDHIVVRPGKSHGFAWRHLGQAAVDWCKERNLVALEGTVWAANARVLKLSELVGFKPVRVLIRKELSQQKQGGG